MDPEDFIQRCAQEDQASIQNYATSSTSSIPVDSIIPLSDAGLPGPRHTDHTRPFNVSTRLAWNCVAPDCSKINSLTLCPTCKAVQYCSRKHLYADRPNHRSMCAKIKKAQAKLDKADKNVKQIRGDAIFNKEWSGIWAYEQREYMSARQALVETLLKVNTALGVILALDHLLDMIRLHLGDRKGARDLVPALYIRLGRDQEAYDFCHWWAATGHASDWDWANTHERYTDTRNADIFEAVGLFIGDRFHLSHVVALTLLKIRLIIDLQSLQRARAVAGPHVPRELLDVIQQHSTLSTVTNNNKVTDREDHTLQIRSLREQVKTLFRAVHKANSHFWPALVEPGENLQARPTAWEQGDERQMQFALQHNYNAWAETPGAINAIGELLEGMAGIR